MAAGWTVARGGRSSRRHTRRDRWAARSGQRRRGARQEETSVIFDAIAVRAGWRRDRWRRGFGPSLAVAIVGLALLAACGGAPALAGTDRDPARLAADLQTFAG